MSKPRVLIIENSIDFTGALNSAVRTGELLRDHFDFHFLLPRGSKSVSYVKEKGFAFYELPMKEIRKNLWSILFYLPFLALNSLRLFKLLKDARINLMVSNDFYNLMPPVYRLLGGQVPYLCYVRFLPSRFPKWLVQIWFGMHARQATKILAVSRRVESELPRHPKVTVIYDGMDHDKTSINWNENNRTILYLANYIPGKGQQYALQSFSELKDEFPEWKLRFVGGDMGLKKNERFKESLIASAKDLGCDHQVAWCGFSAEIKQEFEQASIVLNFSDSESFSLTCLEALFYGRPVIATNSGGPSEIIDNNESGIIISRGDIDAMTVAMRRLMNDAETRKRMGSLGRERVMERFGASQTFERLRDHCLAALA